MAAIYENTSQNRLVLPVLGGLYSAIGGLTELVLRVASGVAFTVHGYGKILNPYGSVGMVERLGFTPGTIWSPLLAGTEFFGGILLILGLLTRISAAATTFVLLVTVYFHWIVLGQGYMGAEKSILWAAIGLYFIAHGGRRWSVDRMLGREF